MERELDLERCTAGDEIEGNDDCEEQDSIGGDKGNGTGHSQSQTGPCGLPELSLE